MSQESRGYRIGISLSGPPRTGYSPRGKAACITVEPERLLLNLDGPTPLLESSGVDPEYVINRPEVVGIEMGWTGALKISHRSPGTPRRVAIYGEWDLVAALRDQGYPLSDVIPWSSTTRRMVMTAALVVEVALLIVMIMTGNFPVGLVAGVTMLMVGVMAWRLQRSV